LVEPKVQSGKITGYFGIKFRVHDKIALVAILSFIRTEEKNIIFAKIGGTGVCSTSLLKNHIYHLLAPNHPAILRPGIEENSQKYTITINNLRFEIACFNPSSLRDSSFFASVKSKMSIDFYGLVGSIQDNELLTYLLIFTFLLEKNINSDNSDIEKIIQSILSALITNEDNHCIQSHSNSNNASSSSSSESHIVPTDQMVIPQASSRPAYATAPPLDAAPAQTVEAAQQVLVATLYQEIAAQRQEIAALKQQLAASQQRPQSHFAWSAGGSSDNGGASNSGSNVKTGPSGLI
jgi:hypothetical protein